jgi:hypothetical protein
MFDEITGAVGKFSLLAEKGTVIFLQAIGACLIILAIVLAWRSESIFEHIVQLVDQAMHQRSSIDPGAPKNEPSNGTEVKLPFGAPQFIVLVVGGVIFVCLGSLIDVTVYKRRLDTYRNAQAYDQESLRMKISLRQSGIQALAETNKVIGNVATDKPAEQRTISEEIPTFGPSKRL